MNRERRLVKAYDKVRRLEQRVDPHVAMKLRGQFDSETIAMVENHQRASGWNRQQRRQFRREMVKGA